MKRINSIMTVVISLLLFMLFSAPVYSAEQAIVEEEPGTIKGQILREGGAAFTPGFVAFFSSKNLDPMDYGQTRRSPKMIAFMNEKGEFTTNLMAPGSYFIGAMERKKWRGGPPKIGENRFSAIDANGKYRIVTLDNGQNLDIGTVVVKVPETGQALTKFFTVEGRLLDKEGKGVADAVVVVKQDYSSPKGEFISDKSAFNGYYQIKLPPGKYFLVARETVEGSMRPNPGSIYGELGHYEPIGIGGKNSKPPTYLMGELGKEFKDVDIMMFEVPIPDLKRKETEALVKADKYSREDLSENLPLRNKVIGSAVKSDLKAVEGEKKSTP